VKRLSIELLSTVRVDYTALTPLGIVTFEVEDKILNKGLVVYSLFNSYTTAKTAIAVDKYNLVLLPLISFNVEGPIDVNVYYVAGVLSLTEPTIIRDFFYSPTDISFIGIVVLGFVYTIYYLLYPNEVILA
jgi:hypothetical protein